MIEFVSNHILSCILWLPVVGAAMIFLLPRGMAKTIGILTLLGDFGLSLHLPYHFINSEAGMQFVEKVPWISSWGIQYGLGIDGLSLWLVLLTTFLGPLVLLSSLQKEMPHSKAFYGFLLLIQTGMIGAFVATDLFLFYIFWEAMLIPMYFLIGIWGGENRLYATMKFFIYTMAGSLFMMIGIIALFLIYQQQFGQFSGNIEDFYFMQISSKTQIYLFAAFAISFLIKVPAFPFHTWLPDAHVQAPTAGSVILAGILLKLGGYGFLRFAMPIFPEGMQFFTPLFLSLAVIGIVYGALVAMVQKDLKKLIAYSSVSHMGYVVLGFFVGNVQGITGGIFQMLSHGLATGGLFLLVGMIYERAHTREIADFGGLAKSMPLFCFFFMIFVLASIGLPGLSGFIGEFLVLLGAFRVHKILAILGGLGIILGAIYMLWTYQRIVFGSTKAKTRSLVDLGLLEGIVLVPIVCLIIYLGVYPKAVLQPISASVERLMQNIDRKPVAHANVNHKESEHVAPY